MATYALTSHAGATDTYAYAITFAFARKDDVRVYIDNVLIARGSGAGKWQYNTALTEVIFEDGSEPQTGETLVIKRVTDISDAATVYTAGSGFTYDDINLALNQLLYSIDELQVPAFTYTTTITLAKAAAIQVPHNLGAAPTRMEIQLECLAADWGWVDGDFVPYSDFPGLVTFDATNMNINENVAAKATVCSALNGDAGILTAAKWNLIIRAWR
jgi:hypothetical protein